MTKRRDKQSKTRSLVRLAALVQLAALLMFFPQDAKAQLVVTDPGSLIQSIANQATMFLQTATTSLSSMVNAEGTRMLAQDQHDGQVQLAAANMMATEAARGSFGSKRDFCPIVNAMHDTQDVFDGQNAMKQALRSATFWAGAGRDDVLAKSTLIGQLCQVGLMDGRDGCQNATASTPDSDHSVFQSHVVVGPMAYPWPSVLQTDGNNHLVVQSSGGAPPTADMPALKAIYYCAIMHTATAPSLNSKSSNLTAVSPERITYQFDRLIDQGKVGTTDDACLGEVAKRLVIGSNATGEMAKIYAQNAKLCKDIKDRMLPSEYDDCTGSKGVSYLTIMRSKACGYGNPTATITDLSAGTSVDDQAKRLGDADNKCDAFLSNLQAEEGRFAQTMRAGAVIRGADLAPPDAARPFQ